MPHEASAKREPIEESWRAAQTPPSPEPFRQEYVRLLGRRHSSKGGKSYAFRASKERRTEFQKILVEVSPAPDGPPLRDRSVNLVKVGERRFHRGADRHELRH
jgi:hypothetical protein